MAREGCITIEVFPADIATCVLHARRKKNTVSAWLTLPSSMIRRYNLQEGEQLVIAFVGRATPPPLNSHH